MRFDMNNFQTDKVGEDLLIVSVDFCNNDINHIIIGRKHGEEIEVVNQFSGDKAMAVYALLLDYAEMHERHAKWEWFDAWDGNDTFGSWKTLRCSSCLESEGARENARFCPNCRAIMDIE